MHSPDLRDLLSLGLRAHPSWPPRARAPVPRPFPSSAALALSSSLSPRRVPSPPAPIADCLAANRKESYSSLHTPLGQAFDALHQVC